MSAKDREHVDRHSRLMKNCLEVLAHICRSGGVTTMEHPSDPGRPPFPSVFDTSVYRWVAMQSGWEEVSFPQCALGLEARKPTTLSGSRCLGLREKFGHLRCTHASHEGLVGKDEETGQFKTRAAQSYPKAMCLALAEMFVEYLSGVPPRGSQKEPEVPDVEEVELGERVVAPEMGENWDPLSRWREVSRWRWRHVEHNNILEARAALAAVQEKARDPANYGRRCLIFTDSQAVLGALAKGRSSRPLMNYIAKRVAALTLATSMRVYWRYVRTHRNWADAPSRALPFGTLGEEKAVALTHHFRWTRG